MTYFILGISAFILILFIIMYLRKPYRIINGFIFDCFLFLALGDLIVFLVKQQNIVFRIILCIILVVIITILLFGIFIVMGYLLVNSIKMAKKEKISFSNSLSLLLLIVIAMQFIIVIFFMKYATNYIVLALFSFFISVEVYLFISGVSFITIATIVLCHFNRVHQDYFVVLGCGLIDGYRVSPLLSGRIDKAITAYNKQKKKGQASKIIFSGGKGSDEKISEAEAMQAYAIQHGVAIEDTLTENRSINTLENMSFSKKIMDDISRSDYACTYVTSDYHVFRAGIYAYKAGLRRVRGIGSKTKGYYYPNAMIREFVALFVMNKKNNIKIISFIFIIYAILWVLLALPR
jgi:uncharacterized SAM-binding protein YcdF (DUF218 family)